jgi:lysine---8-amino-7-oxononanoate aminotransferase
VEHVQESSRLVARLLEPTAVLPCVREVRQRGLMVGIELAADDWRDRLGQRVCARARELGMLTRPLGDVVVFMPPLVSGTGELEEMVAILHQAIADVA